MLNVYLLHGAPSAGKGTIVKKLDAAHVLSVSAILKKQHLDLSTGQLINDDYINALIQDNLLKYKDYVVIDGYPRSVLQAQFIKNCPHIRIKALINLIISDDEITDRVINRQTCACGCSYHPIIKPSKIKNICDACGGALFKRVDDNLSTLKKRLAIFHINARGILSTLSDKRYDLNVSDPYFKQNTTNIAHMIENNQISI